MKQQENIHSGHRQRMTEKLLKSPDTLNDHELLEILLYSFIQRKDTNAIAHKLIRTFGSLKNVFSADAKALMLVDGIGETVASKLVLLSKINDSIKNQVVNEKERKAIFSFYSYKDELVRDFKGLKQEQFIINLLDKKYKSITKLDFFDNNKNKVEADIPEITYALAITKPAFAIIAHNHPSGNVEPSELDDTTTAKINLMCSMHKVTLIDHVIVSDNDAFSYHVSGRLQHIRDQYNFNNITNSLKEKK